MNGLYHALLNFYRRFYLCVLVIFLSDGRSFNVYMFILIQPLLEQFSTLLNFELCDAVVDAFAVIL